uniref:Protein VAC14 homolog n=1 Tax=Panagrolaimus sp. ES5 TaxID=591445 RepID=A0AC34FBK9_9BILA
MADNQYTPLSSAVVRTLTDKLYEKRKSAALEIERQVRELLRQNHLSELEKLITVLEGLTVTPNGHNRKGGLIGLAAVAIALGKDNCPQYAVRYYACESLYNIVKICRASSLEHFDVLFDKFWKLASDADPNVRNGAELLDRLMKEIVTATPNFDLDQLMFHTILKVPSFSITSYIPEVIDGIFKALEDPSPVVKETTTAVLIELMHKLNPKEKEKVDLGAIINILNHHVASSTRKMALEWMEQILKDYSTAMLSNLSSFLIAVLPWLWDDSLKAAEVNARLMSLVTKETKISIDPVVEVLLKHIDYEKTDTRKAVLRWVRHLHANQPAEMYKHIEHFFPRLIDILCDQADDVLELDILLITDISDDVLELDILLITDICGQKQQDVDIESYNLKKEVNDQLRSVRPYLIKFSICLLQKFRADPKLLAERGISIIRQICLLLEPRDVYRSLALLLPDFETFVEQQTSLNQSSVDEFIAKMVGILNGILLTAPEMLAFRQKLKTPEENDCKELFECLYRCWCHQPICLISLCLLSKYYEHAAQLVPRLSEIDVSVDFLREIDRLVQLIESPILSYVRLDLLNSDYQKPLAAVLSALLMLVPQTDTFTTLLKRMQAIPLLAISGPHKTPKPVSTIDFSNLILHFDKITVSRVVKARENHTRLLNESVNKLKL